MRRTIGEEFKDATPSPLIDYIWERNMIAYSDQLGPTFDWLMRRNTINRNMSARDSYLAIINSSQRPNPDIDSVLGGFADWLTRKPNDFIRTHWEMACTSIW